MATKMDKQCLVFQQPINQLTKNQKLDKKVDCDPEVKHHKAPREIQTGGTKTFPPFSDRREYRNKNRTLDKSIHIYKASITSVSSSRLRKKKEMELHDRLFIFHFIYCILLFLSILSCTASDYWSLSRNEFHGLFKSCHVIKHCSSEKHQSAIYRVIQFFQIISCISAISSVVYCFISILLRKYIENKLHYLSIFYTTQTICGSASLLLYIFLIHNKLNVRNKQYGWAIYLGIVFTGLSLIGLFFSFLAYKRQRNSSGVVKMEERELRFHQKSLHHST